MSHKDAEMLHTLVRSFSRLARLQTAYVSKATGLRGNLYRFLISIHHHPGVSQDFLADFHLVDKSRVARVARELESMGYITRTPSESDRRVYSLMLTDAGQEVYLEVQAVLAQWGEVLAGDIPTDTLSQTVDTITRMLENTGNSL